MHESAVAAVADRVVGVFLPLVAESSGERRWSEPVPGREKSSAFHGALFRQQSSKMPGMTQFRERPWFIVLVLVVVFLGALSMHVERMVGWGFLILCFVVGSLGGLGLIWTRNRAAPRWNELSKLQKRIGVATGMVLIIIGTFASNRHKPDEFANDAAVCFGLVVASLLWGLASLMSRIVNALHARLSKR